MDDSIKTTTQERNGIPSVTPGRVQVTPTAAEFHTGPREPATPLK